MVYRQARRPQLNTSQDVIVLWIDKGMPPAEHLPWTREFSKKLATGEITFEGFDPENVEHSHLSSAVDPPKPPIDTDLKPDKRQDLQKPAKKRLAEDVEADDGPRQRRRTQR